MNMRRLVRINGNMWGNTLADAYGLASVYSDDRLELVHCDKPTGKTAAVRFLYPQLGKMADAPRPERLKRLAELMTGQYFREVA